MFLFADRNALLRTAAAALISTLLLGGAALATTPEIADAIKSRKANYKEIGGAFKTINDEVKTGAPSIDTIQPLAKDILKRGAMQMNFFPANSGPESGEKTRAKAAIWLEQDNFRKNHQEFIRATEQLNTAIDAGDVSAIASAQKSLGMSCKSCHDRYRDAD